MENLKSTIASRIINTAQSLGSTATTAKGAHRYIMRTQRHPLSTVEIQPHQLWTSTKKRAWIAGRAERRIVRRRSTIPLGPESAREVKSIEAKDHPQRKNWNAPCPSISDDRYTWTIADNMGQYSSRCTYTRWEYTPCVGCYAIDRGGLGLEFHWRGQVALLQAPHGYRWGKDQNGIRMVSMTNTEKDYHPNSDDLRNYSKRAMLQKIAELHAKRKEAAKLLRSQQRAKRLSEVERKRQEREDLAATRRAEKEGAMICLRDSLAAGNCEAGTRSFAMRHNLDPARHYRPTDLLKIANGDAHRVRLAVAVGLRRHRREMSQGFALLADHR